MLEACLFKSSITCTALEVDRSPFAVPFLFHPCGSHPGGCDTSLAKRQDTKWSADDFGHNLGGCSKWQETAKRFVNPRAGLQLWHQKKCYRSIVVLSVSRKFSCVWIWLFRFLIQIQVWLGLGVLKNHSVSNQHIKKGQQRMCLWVIELNCFLANLISLNRLLGWLGLCIPVWQSTGVVFCRCCRCFVLHWPL